MRSMWGEGRRLALVAALLAAACDPRAPLPGGGEPLAARAGQLRVERETIEVDLGEPAAREHLALGFGADESGPEGSFVRAAGSAAVVRLELWQPRDRVMRLRAWCPGAGARGIAVVRVLLNGRLAARLRLTARPETVEVRLPRSDWLVADNQLRFEPDPPPPGAPRTELDLAIDGLRFADEEAASPADRSPAFSPEADLELPAGAGAGFYLELPPGSWLTWRAIEGGGSEGELEILVREESGRVLRSRRFEAGEGEGRLALTSRDGGLRHLSLGARGSAGTSLRLVAPSLRWPEESAVALLTATSPAATAPPDRPNLVVYLIDTLRADHLGCYGYARPTSPAIDAFAREGVLFEKARAQSSWTRPAVATILTGLQPITHQAQNSNERLPGAIETVAERLRAAGYQTAMVTTNGNVAGRYGFRQGFERFDYLPEDETLPELHVLSDVVDRHAESFLAGRDRARPFFLFLHTTDPHDPYAPREPFHGRLAPGVPLAAGSAARLRELEAAGGAMAVEALEPIVALYDAEIAQNDAAFGALLGRLDRAGLAATTAVLLLSDHGEEFLEHGGWTHGKTLYEEQLRIPLLLRLPEGEGAGARPTGIAEQIDVAPTLLDLAGLAVPADWPGESLLPWIHGAARPQPRGSFAWLSREGHRARSLVQGTWKLIVHPAGPLARAPYHETFRLDRDPQERENLALDHEARREWLAGLLRAERLRRSPPVPVETVKVGPEMRARLRALGYLR
jgi:arylsulfatase A-like enzyme